jgi:hypothetical protein
VDIVIPYVFCQLIYLSAVVFQKSDRSRIVTGLTMQYNPFESTCFQLNAAVTDDPIFAVYHHDQPVFDQ